MHETSIDQIDYYLKKGFVVVYSTWTPSNEKESGLLDIIRGKLSKNKIVVLNLPDTTNIDNYLYVYLQTYSCLEGMNAVSYTIKNRSSMCLNHIKPLINKISKNRDKVLSCDMGFPPCRTTMYHPSDFLIGMCSNQMIHTWKLLKQRLEKKIVGQNWGPYNPNTIASEMKICICYIESKRIKGELH